jgi:hypothetical protein
MAPAVSTLTLAYGVGFAAVPSTGVDANVNVTWSCTVSPGKTKKQKSAYHAYQAQSHFDSCCASSAGIATMQGLGGYGSAVCAIKSMPRYEAAAGVNNFTHCVASESWLSGTNWACSSSLGHNCNGMWGANKKCTNSASGSAKAATFAIVASVAFAVLASV